MSLPRLRSLDEQDDEALQAMARALGKPASQVAREVIRAAVRKWRRKGVDAPAKEGYQARLRRLGLCRHGCGQPATRGGRCDIHADRKNRNEATPIGEGKYRCSGCGVRGHTVVKCPERGK